MPNPPAGPRRTAPEIRTPPAKQIREPLRDVRQLCFDLDDTLVADQAQLQHFEGRAERLLPGFRYHFERTEERNLERYGFGDRSYLVSFTETFHRFSWWRRWRTHERFRDLMAALIAARNTGPEAISDAAPTLAQLQSHGYGLRVITRGPLAEQRAKLDAAGLANYFTGVHSVPQKTPETFRKIAGELALAEGSCCYIGNSLFGDAQPALDAGWYAAWIPSLHTWHADGEELEGSNDLTRRTHQYYRRILEIRCYEGTDADGFYGIEGVAHAWATDAIAREQAVLTHPHCHRLQRLADLLEIFPGV